MKLFLKNLFTETASHGKLLVGYIALQLPYITSLPGFTTVLHTALVDRTTQSYIDLGIQILMGLSAAVKAKQIAIAAINKTV